VIWGGCYQAPISFISLRQSFSFATGKHLVREHYKKTV